MNKQQIKIFSYDTSYQLQEDVNNWLNKCPEAVVEGCNYSRGILIVLYHLGSDNPKYSDITRKLNWIDDSLMDMNN